MSHAKYGGAKRYRFLSQLSTPPPLLSPITAKERDGINILPIEVVALGIIQNHVLQTTSQK